MAKLKVYGGYTFKDGKQVRCVVAATSQKKAADAAGESISHVRNYWSVTGNQDEIDAAMSTPGIPVFREREW